MDQSVYGLGYGLDARGVDFLYGQEILLLCIMSIPTVELTQPPTQWVPGAVCSGVNREGREADHFV